MFLYSERGADQMTRCPLGRPAHLTFRDFQTGFSLTPPDVESLNVSSAKWCRQSWEGSADNMNVMDAHTFEAQRAYRLNYLLYVPEHDKDTSLPLLLYLHGGGESGYDLDLLKTCGLPKSIEEGRTFPFTVLAPQNPNPDRLFSDEAIFALLEEVIRTYSVDTKRIYLTGYSRGGFAAWRMAVQRPDLFAALVPVAAGGLVTYAFRAKEVPVWTFHGALDEVVPLTLGAEMVDALRAAGGNVKLTVFSEADHAQTPQLTYQYSDLYEWLSEQAKD